MNSVISDKKAKGNIYLWNAVGSASNSLASLVLLLSVTRIFDSLEAGIFSIGFALAQQVWSVVNYEMVTFQATDRQDKYSFAQYNGARALLFLVSMAGTLFIVRWRGYGMYKAIAVMLLCFYKCMDAISASFFALFQKNERLDIAGRSMTFKTCISVFGFIVSACFMKNLIAALIIMNILYIIGIVIFDLRYVVCYEKIRCTVDKSIALLLIECFPLFIGSFMIIYISNQPKYVLDMLSSAEIQVAFNIIVMPAFVINLLSMFVFRPFLTQIAAMWETDNLKNFRKISIKLYSFIFLCTLICILAGWFLGVQVLSLIYNVDLLKYRIELGFILLGGGMNAIAVLSYNILASIRQQRYVLPIYVVAFVVSLGISKPLIGWRAMAGASLSYLLPISLIAILLVLCIIYEFRKKKLKVEEELQ